MTEHAPDGATVPAESDRPATAPKSRRRFLAAVGAGGLATAVAVFGRSTAAFAGNYQCCNLVYPPPDSHYTSYSTCTNGYNTYPLSHYTWSCSVNGSLHCNCCEGKAYGSTVASAAQCQYN